MPWPYAKTFLGSILTLLASKKIMGHKNISKVKVGETFLISYKWPNLTYVVAFTFLVTVHFHNLVIKPWGGNIPFTHHRDELIARPALHQVSDIDEDGSGDTGNRDEFTWACTHLTVKKCQEDNRIIWYFAWL